MIHINLDNVLSTIRQLTQMSDEEIEKVTPFAIIAIAYVEKMSSANDNRLVTLAAAKAIYEYSLLWSNETISSFSAGDVKITSGKSSYDTKAFYNACLENSRDLIGDLFFDFRVV